MLRLPMREPSTAQITLDISASLAGEILRDGDITYLDLLVLVLADDAAEINEKEELEGEQQSHQAYQSPSALLSSFTKRPSPSAPQLSLVVEQGSVIRSAAKPLCDSPNLS